jgi:hypothetical protein
LTLAAVAAGCASAPDGAGAPSSGGALGSPAIQSSHGPSASWRRAMVNAPLQKDGCFEVTHPSTTWIEVPCTTPPNIPQMPAHGPAPQTVGNGSDVAAQGSGPITWAEGSFPIVSGVTSETDSTANDYSLQLNSNPFSGAGPCSGAAVPSSCMGWEQFVYAPGYAFIQYWLLNYSNACPAGWNTYGSDCWKNSTSGAPMPAEPITALGAMTLTGTAGSADSIVMSVGDGTLYRMSQASVLNLNTGWTSAEFNVFGDGNGSGATFNTGSTIAVQVLTDSTGSANGPSCESAGYTGETNNLSILPGSY